MISYWLYGISLPLGDVFCLKSLNFANTLLLDLLCSLTTFIKGGFSINNTLLKNRHAELDSASVGIDTSKKLFLHQRPNIRRS